MDTNTLLILLIIFVAVSAIALLIQAVMLAGMFLLVRELRKRTLPILPEVEKIIASVHNIVILLEKRIETISASTVEIVNLSKQQVAKLDELLNDATTRAKVQMERAEMVLDDTMGRVTDTVSLVQRGVIRPIREVQGLVSGLKTAIQYLGRGSRSTVDHATSDEEMFI
jgi:hypothetical protein